MSGNQIENLGDGPVNPSLVQRVVDRANYNSGWREDSFFPPPYDTDVIGSVLQAYYNVVGRNGVPEYIPNSNTAYKVISAVVKASNVAEKTVRTALWEMYWINNPGKTGTTGSSISTGSPSASSTKTGKTTTKKTPINTSENPETDTAIESIPFYKSPIVIGGVAALAVVGGLLYSNMNRIRK